MENRTADAVGKHLSTLGLVYLAEWDVLAFIYRHGASLASAEKIASLLGYTKSIVGSTLEALTAKGLVQRSRNSHGVRIYRSVIFAPHNPLQIALDSLIGVAEDRRGRLLITGHLLKAAARDDLRQRGLHLA